MVVVVNVDSCAAMAGRLLTADVGTVEAPNAAEGTIPATFAYDSGLPEIEMPPSRASPPWTTSVCDTGEQYTFVAKPNECRASDCVTTCTSTFDSMTAPMIESDRSR